MTFANKLYILRQALHRVCSWIFVLGWCQRIREFSKLGIFALQNVDIYETRTIYHAQNARIATSC